MIKVLIVEDEVLARLGLHQLIDWNALGFELLEDAKTGKEAIERIETQHPQIILLDLNIPEINGVEIQRRIHEQRLNCYTVVISCNDDFSTVKDVMRYGAFDFLRKLNLTSEALTSVLERCKQEIQGLTTTPNRFATPTLENLSSYESLFKSNRCNNIFASPYVCTSCIVPSHVELPFHEVLDICKVALDQYNVSYHLITKGEKSVYLLLKEQQSQEFFILLQKKIADILSVPVHISIYESVVQNLADLTSAFAIVDCAHVYAYYDSPETILYVSSKKLFHTTCPFDFSEDCNRLKHALENFSESEIKKSLSIFFTKLRSHEMLTENLLKRMFIDILSFFSATAQRLHGSLEDVYLRGGNYHYQNVTQLNSINLTEEWFLEFTKAFIDKFFIRFKCANSDILSKVFTYIENNISQPIQLASTAKSIGISEAYLSSFFKKEIGQNFISYVNTQKIVRAQAMLQEGCLAYQVSEALGFDNYSYFSKVFKKYTNTTPDDYRKQFCK